MARKPGRGGHEEDAAKRPKSSRQLRVGEELRHALARLFERGGMRDPELRDVSISYDVPVRLLHGAARRASVTLAGHNLKIWTTYAGADPEVNTSGPALPNRDDSWTVPQTRRYSASVAFSF